MSQIKEFLDNKKENQMIFTVYTPDSKPKERIFKDFDEIKKYAGIISAGHFFREGGVSPDGVVRLEPANDYTMQFLKEEAAIEEYTYSNGNFIEDLLPNFNKILEETSPVSAKDYVLLNEKLKDKIEKDGSTIFMINPEDKEFNDFMDIDNFNDVNIESMYNNKKGGHSIGAYHYEDTLTLYDYRFNKLFVVDLRGEAQNISDILQREKIEGVNKIGVMKDYYYHEDDHKGYTKTGATLLIGKDQEVEKAFSSFENKIEEINRLVNEGELDDSRMYYYTEKDGFTHSQENPLHIEEAVQLFDEVKIYFPKDDPFGFIFAHEAEITKDTLIKAGSVNGNLYIEGTNGQVVEFKLGDKVELNENPKISNGLENNPNYEFQYSKRLDDPKPKSSRRPKM